MYIGSQFLLEFRYSQLVTTIYICFLFSAGIPLLYVIAFFTFFVTYWVDKILSKYALELTKFSTAILQDPKQPSFRV